MGFQFHKTKKPVLIFIFCVIFVCCFEQILAVRPLGGDRWLEKGLVIQSLQRGQVPPSRVSPCTYIPGRGSGRCALSEMNVAGHVVAHAEPAFPDVVVEFAAASVANETQKQDSSS